MEPHSGLNIVDYSVLGIILLSGLLALMRGFVREVFSLVAWVGAYFAAAKYYALAEPWTHRWVKSQTGATALAAVIVFILVLTILSLAGHLIAKLIRGKALTAIDRSLGFLFGLLRGVLIVCLLYLGASYFPWLNMDKLDKPQTAQIATPAPGQTPAETAKEKEKDEPPEWLVEAKTRPALAAGADVLRTFIPEKEIEKTLKEYDDQKASAQRTIDEHAAGMMGMPMPVEKPAAPSAYDDKSRSGLDNLIKDKQ